MSNMFGTKFRFSDISRTSVQALKTFSGSSALLDAKTRFESWNTRTATNIRNPLRAEWWRSRRTFGEQSLRSTASMQVFLRFWARLVFDISMMMIENNSTKSGKVFLWSRDNRSDQQKSLQLMTMMLKSNSVQNPIFRSATKPLCFTSSLGRCDSLSRNWETTCYFK